MTAFLCPPLVNFSNFYGKTGSHAEIYKVFSFHMLVPSTTDLSRGGNETTQGQRSQGNRHLEPHFKAMKTN